MAKKILIAVVLACIVAFLFILVKDSVPTLYNIFYNIIHIVGSIFVRLLKFTIIPVVIFSLLSGIINLKSTKELGFLGLTTIVAFTLTTAIALFFAIGISNFIKLGSGFNIKDINQLASAPNLAKPQSFIDNIITLAPDNIISPLLNVNMIQLIIVIIIFGIAILQLSSSLKIDIKKTVSTLEAISMQVITMIMKLTPIAVFALLTKTILMQGFNVLHAILYYALTMLVVLLFHFVVLYIPLIKYSKVTLKAFFKKMTPASLLAFSTASSSATLPVSLQTAENSFKIPKSIAGFVLPLGSTLHMNGTAIMQGVALVFLANLYGVEMSIMDYIGAGTLALIATIGAAGVPGAGLVTLTLVLIQYNIPVEGIGIIIGIDRILDMTRTVINVMGDMIVAILITKQKKELDVKFINDKTK